MNRFPKILFLACFVLSSCLQAQTRKLERANAKYEQLSYSKAIRLYESVINSGYGSAEIYEKLANSYYYNSNSLKAAKWYEKFIASDENGSTESYFRYANVLKTNGNIEEANRVLNKIGAINETDSRIKKIKEDPNYIDNIKSRKNKFTVRNLPINSKFSDFAPAVYKDNLVFASARDTGWVSKKVFGWNQKSFLDLYIVENSDSRDGNSIHKLSGSLNTRIHESSSTFSSDGKTIYFTRNNSKGNKVGVNKNGIALLKLHRAMINKNGEWGNIEVLPFNSDDYSTAHPSLNKSGSKLYFSSDMTGTFGQSDIYMIDVFEDGSFGAPLNLGGLINTEGRETFPFISDDDVLYFASDGHPGLGGLDIFKVDLKKPESEMEVVNLGEPINSRFDDFTLVYKDEIRGYFASNREGGMGSDDIYAFEENRRLIRGLITDRNEKKPFKNTLIKLYDKDKAIDSTYSGVDGQYSFTISNDKDKLRVVANVENYDKVEKNIEKTDDFVVLSMYKTPTKVKEDLTEALALNDVLFDFDKHKVKEESKKELNKIVEYLKEHSDKNIEIASHTDSRGSAAYNLYLSEKRAKATAAYIVSKGISANRITAKGYGESMLKNNCADGVKCSKEQHRLNRRSEFIIVN